MRDDFEVNIVEEGVVEWDSPRVITGFPGPGFVGESTAMLIVDALKMREIAHVESELIPPMLVVMGLDLRPPFRVYAEEEVDLMVVVDNQPIPMEHHRILSRRLMDWLKEKRVEEIFLLDGLPVPDETLEGRVIGLSSNEERLLELGRLGVLPLTGGAVTGMNAALLEICRERGVPWTGFLAPTRSIGSPNWKGITSMIEVLNMTLGISIDMAAVKKTVGMSGEPTISAEKPRKGGVFNSIRRRMKKGV